LILWLSIEMFVEQRQNMFQKKTQHIQKAL
jgi:hypothetical protein